VREVTSKTFKYSCAVVPKWLTLGEESEKSDLVSSCFLVVSVGVSSLHCRFEFSFGVAFDPIRRSTELTCSRSGEGREVGCHGGHGEFERVLHLSEGARR
jgi:hypothetical protein